MDNTEKIIKAFADAGKPLRPGEAAEAANIEKKDAEKVIKQLVNAGQLVSPKRCFYELKK
jgi:hypothetical protein